MVAINDLLERQTVLDQFEDHHNSNTCPTNTGLAAIDCRIDHNSVCSHADIILTFEASSSRRVFRSPPQNSFLDPTGRPGSSKQSTVPRSVSESQEYFSNGSPAAQAVRNSFYSPRSFLPNRVRTPD